MSRSADPVGPEAAAHCRGLPRPRHVTHQRPCNTPELCNESSTTNPSGLICLGAWDGKEVMLYFLRADRLTWGTLFFHKTVTREREMRGAHFSPSENVRKQLNSTLIILKEWVLLFHILFQNKNLDPLTEESKFQLKKNKRKQVLLIYQHLFWVSLRHKPQEAHYLNQQADLGQCYHLVATRGKHVISHPSFVKGNMDPLSLTVQLISKKPSHIM